RLVGQEIGTSGDILTGMGKPTVDGGDETAADGEEAPAGPDASENTRGDGWEPQSTDKAASMAQRLIELWQEGDLPDDDAGRRLTIGMDALDRAAGAAGSTDIEFGPIASRYQPLLAGTRPADGGGGACWQGSLLTQSTVGGALFWLDLLSVTRELSLTDLGDALQPPVIEAALNPEGAEECAVRNGRSIRSVYIYEARRNPLFADFVMRDLPTFTLDIAGVSFSSERFIQTRDGRKMREGAAPDATSRIATVGELGLAIQRSDGYAKVLFDDGVNWIIR
ncbi:MAG: hypothetical protein H7Y08_07255, partial [Rhizobiaceae bacterium]|nr:hypothetical protein [Rhizobiaceae bacterium]